MPAAFAVAAGQGFAVRGQRIVFRSSGLVAGQPLLQSGRLALDHGLDQVQVQFQRQFALQQHIKLAGEDLLDRGS